MAWLLDSFELAWIARIVIRLLLTAILAGAIGYERESANRPAGFRTHILVGIGACLVTLTAAYLAGPDRSPAEPGPELSRMAAAVVSGIGFLGAGTIIRDGTSIHGLTTAASVWTVACIGLAVGAGFSSGALAAAFITLITLAVLIRFESDADGSSNARNARRPQPGGRKAGAGAAARSGEGSADSSAPGSALPESPPIAPGSGPDFLDVALDRDSHDILSLLRLLDSYQVPVRAVQVLDSSDKTGRSIHIRLMTDPMSPLLRAGIIDRMLLDRRVIRMLPDSGARPAQD